MVSHGMWEETLALTWQQHDMPCFLHRKHGVCLAGSIISSCSIARLYTVPYVAALYLPGWRVTCDAIVLRAYARVCFKRARMHALALKQYSVAATLGTRALTSQHISVRLLWRTRLRWRGPVIFYRRRRKEGRHGARCMGDARSASAGSSVAYGMYRSLGA